MTTPSESCPICNGTGWQIRQRENEREVVRCECRVREQSGRLLAATHIPAKYRACDFETFVPANEKLRLAEIQVRKFVESYPVEREGLLFVGNVGVGKTHLAVSALKGVVKKGIQCLFVDYRELLKAIQDSYNPEVQTTELSILRPVFETEVVLFDELGAVRPTQWVLDTVAHIINSRYNQSKTTLFTTNFPDLPPGRLQERERGEFFTEVEKATRDVTLGDRIEEAMWSRLHEMCKSVEMEGEDYRRKYNSARLVRSRLHLKGKKQNDKSQPEE